MAPKPKSKTPQSPSQPPPPIEDLFTSLNKHIQRSEFKQAVKVADQGSVLQIRRSYALNLPCRVNCFLSVLSLSMLQFSELPLETRMRSDARSWL